MVVEGPIVIVAQDFVRIDIEEAVSRNGRTHHQQQQGLQAALTGPSPYGAARSCRWHGRRRSSY